MARHTTFRIGGPAALLLICDSLSDLSHSLEILAEEGVEWTVLGKGSNVVVPDEGYGGAVIVLGREFKRHHTDGERIQSGSGVILAALVQDSYSRGLSGLEFGVGIPGTVGGALAMNAGTRDEWIGSRVETVTLFSPGRGLVVVRGVEVEWGYRISGLPDMGVVVECAFALDHGDKAMIRRDMDARFLSRKATQPMGLPTAGSVFVNPTGDSAGRLIESAGLKGLRFGGAQVSEVHANFIVNVGGATATEVLALVDHIRKVVIREHGIELQTEIRVLGGPIRA